MSFFCLCSPLQALSRVIPRGRTFWKGCWMLSNRLVAHHLWSFQIYSKNLQRLVHLRPWLFFPFKITPHCWPDPEVNLPRDFSGTRFHICYFLQPLDPKTHLEEVKLSTVYNFTSWFTIHIKCKCAGEINGKIKSRISAAVRFLFLPKSKETRHR